MLVLLAAPALLCCLAAELSCRSLYVRCTEAAAAVLPCHLRDQHPLEPAGPSPKKGSVGTREVGAHAQGGSARQHAGSRPAWSSSAAQRCRHKRLLMGTAPSVLCARKCASNAAAAGHRMLFAPAAAAGIPTPTQPPQPVHAHIFKLLLAGGAAVDAGWEVLGHAFCQVWPHVQVRQGQRRVRMPLLQGLQPEHANSRPLLMPRCIGAA